MSAFDQGAASHDVGLFDAREDLKPKIKGIEGTTHAHD
jgi:hypothetical protein